MHQIFEYLLSITADLGYLGIVFLMAIESSFIPFPSEIVIPPAAFLASRGEMNIILIIVAGIFGSLLGATVNYYLAMSLGRKVIYSLADKKIARIFLINKEKIKKAESYFLMYGNMSTFVGRLVPAVRQLISIPAGFSQMNFKKFIFYTFLGSGLWVTVLAILGYVFGANQELLAEYSSIIKLIGIIFAILFVAYLVLRSRKQK